jgi:hypothetical protein
MNWIRKEQNDSGWPEPYPANPVHPVKNVFFGCGFIRVIREIRGRLAPLRFVSFCSKKTIFGSKLAGPQSAKIRAADRAGGAVCGRDCGSEKWTIMASTPAKRTQTMV